MSNTIQNAAVTSFGLQAQDAGKTPAFIAYHVAEREGKENIWTRIGAAWDHKDGKGLNLQIELLPVQGTGRIVLRAYQPKEEAAPAR